MHPRFFSSQPIDAPFVELQGPEQHHLVHALRLREGDRVTLFDNSGWEFEAKVTELQRNVVRLKIMARHEIDRELPFALSLGVALPKGERQQWLVEKAVELGVTQLVPLMTERGVAQPRDKSLQRLQRWVVAAAKQCGRNRLMHVANPNTVEEFVHRAENNSILVAHPSADAVSVREAVDQLRTDGNPIFLAIGPEGGFTDRELSLAHDARCCIVNLSTRILRIETAAIFLVASVVYAKA